MRINEKQGKGTNIMNLIDMNANDIMMCIEGRDIEMKYPICQQERYPSFPHDPQA
jgi:hypothetical protein